MASVTIPTSSSAGPNTSPKKMIARAIEARIGWNDGTGAWTPGGGSSRTTTSAVSRPRSWSCSRIASRPQYNNARAIPIAARGMAMPPATRANRTRKVAIAPKNGANDGTGG